MDDRPTFGGKIKQRRMELGITQEILAQRVGCALITIQKIESGGRRASHQMATRIAASLSIPSNDLADFLAAARRSLSDTTPRDTSTRQPYQHTHLLQVPTPFLGRDHDVVKVRQLLIERHARLITFIGPPGVGKSSLAIHVATTLHNQFADGVILLSLAGLADARFLPATMAHLLGVRDTSIQACQDGVLAKLQDRQVLLVLDNMEHLLDSVPFVMTLLDELPSLTVFVTSRVRLGLTREQCYHVAPLLLPDTHSDDILATSQEASAVALFVARAQTYNATFTLTEQNIADVIELCVHLDGLPLAIELAAAWTHILPISAMRTRMRHRLDWLRNRMNDRPAHQHTMRATLDWSYTLLDPGAQHVFRCMGVFMAGCSLDALRAVVTDTRLADETVLLDILGVLVNHHLVTQVADTGEPRFVMLETIRDYAMEQLIASGDIGFVAQYQKDFFLTLTNKAAASLRARDQKLWLERLTLEHDNLRYVWDRAQFNSDTDTLLQLGKALWRFWWLRNHWTEGRNRLEQVLAQTAAVQGHPEMETDMSRIVLLRAQVLRGLGALAWAQDDGDAAHRYHTMALDLYTSVGDEYGMAAALHNLGLVLAEQNEIKSAQENYEASLYIKRRLGDMGGIAASLNNLGVVRLSCGDTEAAHMYFAESLALYEELGNLQGAAFALHNLGDLTTIKGNYMEAYALYHQSLAIARQLGIQTTIISKLYRDIGIVLCLQNNYDTALHWLSQSLRIAISEDWPEGIQLALRGLAATFSLLGETGYAKDLFRAIAQRPRLRNEELIDIPLVEKARQYIGQALTVEVGTVPEVAQQTMSLEQASGLALALAEQYQSSETNLPDFAR
ncbi:MAG: hypothetical protein GFH27_549327n21 [Chloroflexi bacterium AL-W]|nr:hypothetical protein [Chloroflexi bacterium AL-N1]NOK69633.1 hypothetical protein [Chloroflexi bacterium AL-N10]NOK72180.1 hypothetical protein [Chloroflexi bacterium AL-N5]NOK85009.1 hypothetical protein [Chloroflexi bacterium AL-W]NOK91762.1 hypothetical protein [Chloroflexi bacterium AL-N15]